MEAFTKPLTEYIEFTGAATTEVSQLGGNNSYVVMPQPSSLLLLEILRIDARLKFASLILKLQLFDRAHSSNPKLKTGAAHKPVI